MAAFVQVQQALSREEWRYVGAGALASTGLVFLALGLRHTLHASDRFGDPDCDASVYQAVLTGLNATQAYNAWYYAPVITDAAIYWGVDPDLMMAIAHTESRFNPRAGSSAGAQGLMQIMPSTGRLFYKQLTDLGEWPFLELDLWDPKQSAWIGAKHVHDSLRRRGSVQEALASYNCGSRCPKGSAFESWPGETQRYVRRVPARRKLYREIWERCASPLAL